MDFAYSEPLRLDPVEWTKLADGTGITVNKIVVETLGSIHRDGGKILFRVHRTEQTFALVSPLAEGPSPPGEPGIQWVQAEMEGWKSGAEITLKILQSR